MSLHVGAFILVLLFDIPFAFRGSKSLRPSKNNRQESEPPAPAQPQATSIRPTGHPPTRQEAHTTLFPKRTNIEAHTRTPSPTSRPTAPRYSLRTYQARILERIKSTNSIVVLPTGSGKTVIAAEAIRLHLLAATNSRTGRNSLFLVPKRMLVTQQAAAIRNWYRNIDDPSGSLPFEVAEYCGGMALPNSSFRVLVTTPEAFRNAQEKHPHLFGWDHFCHVTFDEVHQSLKKHPYREIALDLSHVAPPHGHGRNTVRILGLTASLSYKISDVEICQAIRKLLEDLDIEQIVSAKDEELRDAGYHGNTATAEMWPQLAKLQDSISTRISLSGDAVDVFLRSFWAKHDFWSRVDVGDCTPFTAALVAAVTHAEGCIEDSTFSSQIAPGAKTREQLSVWGKNAAKRRREVVRQVNEIPEALEAAYWALEQWYGALRILAISEGIDDEGPVMFLKMMFNASTATATAAQHYYREQQPASTQAKGVPGLRRLELDFLGQYYEPTSFTHFVRLKQALSEKLQLYGDKFRGILFVQQRVTVHVLTHALGQDPETAGKFKCAALHATNEPATPSLVITKPDATDALMAFAAGRANLLVSTVVAEEGMDIPAANCVFRFDPVVTPVSYVQGRGRARQTDASLVIMREKASKPVKVLQEAESLQHQFVMQLDTFHAKAAQKLREHAARAVLANLFEVARSNSQGALYTLNRYVSETEAELEETFLGENCSGMFEWQLTYRSCLRIVEGRGRSKRLAAMVLLQNLYSLPVDT